MGKLIRRLCTPLPLAIAMTLANAAKPPVADDAAYLAYARQISQDPIDPYGFRFIWYQEAQPAFDILVPPVLPYWLAAGMGCVGDDAAALKLWCFPLNWVFSASLFALFRRFAPGRERPLLAMTALSPVFLPAVNLMLDVPAIGLMAAGVALYLRGGSLVAAGCVLGLAAQTKYTALMGVPVVLLHGAIYRRWGAVLTAGVAVSAVAGWELAVASVYGESHFLHHLSGQGSVGQFDPNVGGATAAGDFWERKGRLLLPMLGYAGGLGSAVGLLAWAAAGRRVAGLMLIIMGGVVLLAVVPPADAVLVRSAGGQERLTLNSLLMGGNCLLSLGGMASLAFRSPLPPAGGRGDRRVTRDFGGCFLLLWLAGEVAGYFVLSPFGAARRLMGPLLVATLLAGRLAAKREIDINAVAGFGVLLGIGYATIDSIDALPERHAAEWAARHTGGTVWYCGHWGFAHHAERLGMKPVHPGETVLRPGDFLVYPDLDTPPYRPYGQRLKITDDWAEPIAQGEFHAPIPVRTNSEYYGGTTPLVTHRGPRVTVTVYRIIRESQGSPR